MQALKKSLMIGNIFYAEERKGLLIDAFLPVYECEIYFLTL